MDVRRCRRTSVGWKEVSFLLHFLRCRCWCDARDCTVLLGLFHARRTAGTQLGRINLCHASTVHTAQRANHCGCLGRHLCPAARLRHDVSRREDVYHPYPHPHQGQVDGARLHCHRVLLRTVHARQQRGTSGPSRWHDLWIFSHPLLEKASRTVLPRRQHTVLHQSQSEVGPTLTAGNPDWDYNANKRANQEEVDRILDKIRKSGYDSLTREEKQKLFDQSKK